MGRGVAVAAAAAWLAGAGVSAAQPAFPETLDRDALVHWLKRETDITPESVIAVTPQTVTAVVSSFPGGGGKGPRVVIRAEALSADTYARTGALSWHVSLNADCGGRKVKLGETTGYPERNLLGERRTLRPADADWRRPEPGTALDSALRAACDKDFHGPLDEGAMKVVRPDASTAGAPSAAKAAAKPAPAPKAAAPAKAAPTKAPAAAAAKPPAPAPASQRSGPVVQVGAAPSEGEARRLLAALGARLEGRPTWVETAVVAGRTWRRAVIGGFADRAAAGRFCAGLKTAGRACFVRAGGAR